jgi:predicted nuclease of predicted toxin-antitoxin system
MRFLADENCDRLLIAVLREAGHDVVSAAEWGGGISDEDLLRRAWADRRIIITNDRDFGLLVERAAERPPAVILLRLAPLARLARTSRLVDALMQLKNGIDDELVVIEPTQIRRRRYQRPV